MTIVEVETLGDEVWMKGIVAKSNATAGVGDTRYLTVSDNGEGANASGPDGRSKLYKDAPKGEMYSLNRGNIQTR